MNENLTDYCYRKLKFTDNQLKNFQLQLCALKENKDICSCLKSYKKSKKNNVFYILLSPSEIENEKDNLLPEKLNNTLLGINSLIFLEHQNIDNFCKLYYKHKNSASVYNDIVKYMKVYDTVSKLDKDRILIHSGLIYQFLGTIYSNDIDLLIIAKRNDEFDKFNNIFKKFDSSSIILPDKNKMKFPYKKEWFTYKLPRLGGADDIFTMMINPKFHFYYMGIKCIDIFTNIQKTISRSKTEGMVDMYLLDVLNHFDTKMCIKNISIQQGIPFVIVDKIEDMYKRSKQLLKNWYNIDVSIEYFRKKFKLCTEIYDTIYMDTVNYMDPIVKLQVKLHRMISQVYIVKYGKNVNYLLDIGGGKLSGAYIYDKLKIKNVYMIEPSMYSLNTAKKTAMKYPNVHLQAHTFRLQSWRDQGRH